MDSHTQEVNLFQKNALNKADYKCEINCDHPTFRRRNSPLNYTEPHHIVPMSKQDYFENSLDVEENIISLCCNCHKQIHLGKGFEDMLRKIYAERKDVLKKSGNRDIIRGFDSFFTRWKVINLREDACLFLFF